MITENGINYTFDKKEAEELGFSKFTCEIHEKAGVQTSITFHNIYCQNKEDFWKLICSFCPPETKKMKLICITYPHFLSKFYYLWKKLLCKRGFHLFDEVLSNGSGQWVRSLVCDACGLEIEIKEK